MSSNLWRHTCQAAERSLLVTWRHAFSRVLATVKTNKSWRGGADGGGVGDLALLASDTFAVVKPFLPTTGVP